MDIAIWHIRPNKKLLYLILVSAMILFTCKWIFKPPKQINDRIRMLLKLVLVLSVIIELIPFVMSKKPFMIVW